MCGILGLYGDDTHCKTSEKLAFIKDGLYFDAVRGKESTGIAMLYREKGVAPGVYKRALHAKDFLEQDMTRILLSNLNDTFGVMGHNRSATRGSVTDNNAHPFQVDHITLVHNGTVSNADTLLDYKDRPVGGKFKVDSAHVAYALAKGNPDELLPAMKGGFSLVWWDARDQTLHFARNQDRPMWWGVSKDKRSLYYASERGFLYLLTNRIGIDLLDDLVLNPQPGHHYIFSNPGDVSKWESRPFVKPFNRQGGGGKAKNKHHTNPTQLHPKQSLLPAVIVEGDFHDPKTSTQNTQKTNSSSTPTVGTGTEMTVTDRGSVQRTTTSANRPSHPCIKERITRGIAGTIIQVSQQKQQRTLELCADVGIVFGKAIIVEPTDWRPYSEDTKMGFMTCYHHQFNCFVQVFDVSLAKWNEYSGCHRVPVIVINHRATYEAQNDLPVFVGNVREDMLKDHSFASSKNRKQEDAVNVDTGTKMDWVHVGNVNRRLVPPEEYIRLTEDGCYSCNDGIAPAHCNDLVWFGPNDDEPLCPKCAKDEQVLLTLEVPKHVTYTH